MGKLARRPKCARCKRRPANTPDAWCKTCIREATAKITWRPPEPPRPK